MARRRNDDRMSGQERPPIERRLPPATPPQIPQPQVVSLETLTYQVGSVQSQLTHGLESLNRTLERGLDTVDRRLLSVESATNEIRQTLVAQNARIDALEEFQRRQEDIEKERARVQNEDFRASLDSTLQQKIQRWLVTSIVVLVGVVGSVVGILASFHVL